MDEMDEILRIVHEAENPASSATPAVDSSFSSIAIQVASFYRTLREQDMEPAIALSLTLEFSRHFFARVFNA